MKTDVEAKTRISLGMRCGDCCHLSKGPKCFEKMCNELGKTSNSAACPSFNPDLTKLVSVKSGQLQALAHIVNDLGPSQLRLLALTFRNLDYVKKSGFEWGQQVFFSIDTRGNLDSYFSGYVVSSNQSGRILHIASNFDHLQSSSAMLSLETKSVLTEAQFIARKTQLIKQGKIETIVRYQGERYTTLELLRLPKYMYKLLKQSIVETPVNYVPPTIDTVPTTWLDKRIIKSVVPPTIAKAKLSTTRRKFSRQSK